MSSSSKTVKFRRESPSGGSYLDHQRSDSGVGSFSDSDSRGPYGDRYAGSDYDSPGIQALQDQLDIEIAAKKEWMKKSAELDAMLIRAHKESKETEARMRALEDHVQEVKSEKDRLEKVNKELVDENNRLRDDLAKDKDSKDKDKRASRRKSESPPLMSGANPATAEKPKRSGSKHRSSRETSGRADREKERERIAEDRVKEQERDAVRESQRVSQREDHREMDRLRRRFDARERGEESDATGKSSVSTKSHRSRRDSYVEPLGQAAPRPQHHGHGPVPPSPGVRGAYSYTANPYPPQTQYAQPGTTPRAAHPQVVVSYSDSAYDDEDGLYHAHPLPKQQRSQDRRR
ncbi:hypothetical protein QBC39DRAFT_20034 [Podospora conica]|nr:hypothetical protein QBC39DRAFT_20034 [Schizothecium conicum]